MSAFLTPIAFELLFDGNGRALKSREGRQLWRVVNNAIAYRSDIGGLIVIPVGFITDFASVPRLPLAYLLTGDTAHAAAIVHDYLYETGTGSKLYADCIFAEVMEVIGEPQWRQRLMFIGVVIGGRGNFK